MQVKLKIAAVLLLALPQLCVAMESWDKFEVGVNISEYNGVSNEGNPGSIIEIHVYDFDIDESCFVLSPEYRHPNSAFMANQTRPVPITSKLLEERHQNDGPENIIHGVSDDEPFNQTLGK